MMSERLMITGNASTADPVQSGFMVRQDWLLREAGRMSSASIYFQVIVWIISRAVETGAPLSADGCSFVYTNELALPSKSEFCQNVTRITVKIIANDGWLYSDVPFQSPRSPSATVQVG